jgi:hypothetical protein
MGVSQKNLERVFAPLDGRGLDENAAVLFEI